MIGVISKPEQAGIVAEFFELFKTPWEFYEQGRAYDVLLATAGNLPGGVADAGAKLLLAYGSDTKGMDVPSSIVAGARRQSGSVDYQGTVLPIRGRLTTFDAASAGTSCLMAGTEIAGLRQQTPGQAVVIRIGYDVFREIEILLSAGQPIEDAEVPALEIHIEMLRNWILNEGISVLEVPPVPAGHDFTVCLTHDIDFVGIRNHKFDHTMMGFLYRSTVGAVQKFLRGRSSLGRLLATWRAAASLPLVYLGWVKDFWEPFEWYLKVEKDLPATYFLIPFKGVTGENVPGPMTRRRATAYDVADLSEWTTRLQSEGCELGVHGIDSWHSSKKGAAELARLRAVTGESAIGIRMHWLLNSPQTASVLEESGYAYDSTAGFNETIGYRNGSTQVFRPMGATTLLELPMHIQDGALFRSNRLDLTEAQAGQYCAKIIANTRRFGGVLTVLWHDRSHGPERFWGEFYVGLVASLKSLGPWFATAAQAVNWFRVRRQAQFENAAGGCRARDLREPAGEEGLPLLRLRVWHPREQNRGACSEGASHKFTDIPWRAGTTIEFDRAFNILSEVTADSSAA